MKSNYEQLFAASNNFVLLGEAGCGKSEIAMNIASFLSKRGETHYFDLDQTKPLFRARDFKGELISQGINMHYIDQCLDSPTIVGGVRESIINSSQFTVLDVGGNENGARMIGRFSAVLNHFETKIFYVVNPYLPWSKNTQHLDATMSAILRVSRLCNIHILANPNIGIETTATDYLNGMDELQKLLDPYVSIDGACVNEDLFDLVKCRVNKIPLFPLKLHIRYAWSEY